MMRKFSVSLKTCQDSFSMAIFFVTLFSIVWPSFSPATCPFPFQLWYQFGIGAIFYMATLPIQKHDNRWKSLFFNYNYQLVSLLFSIALFRLAHRKVFHQIIDEHKYFDGSDPRQPVLTILFIIVLYATKPFDAKIAHNILFRQFMRLGVISYSIYLLHRLIQPFIDAGLRKLGLDHYWYFPNYLLQIVIPIALSIPFYILIEKKCISQRRLKITENEKSLALNLS
jgi:peptidoglycan/LPS O-acetylase OafA/YrhL